MRILDRKHCNKLITSLPKLKSLFLLLSQNLKGKESKQIKKGKTKYTSECNDSPRVYGHHKKILCSI